MRPPFCYTLLAIVVCCTLNGRGQATQQPGSWSKGRLLFEETGTKNWQEKWMLDGERAHVRHTAKGMELMAGPEYGNDTCHTVLWTKQSFQGDICIEFDYTRTDTATRAVNILYFHATGKGDPDHPVDIALWNDKRVVPQMRTYFNNMHAYHISYAAFPADAYSPGNDYIRLRRYNPDNKGLQGTLVSGDHFKTGLFRSNVPYHIRVVKYKNHIEMHIQNKQNPSENLTCAWDVSTVPPCDSGRIGLRHMYTRRARYANFKVWELE